MERNLQVVCKDAGCTVSERCMLSADGIGTIDRFLPRIQVTFLQITEPDVKITTKLTCRSKSYNRDRI